MSEFLEEVADQLNLRWAWEKLRREARPGDIWYDNVELAGFELELQKNLQSIANDLRKGIYKIQNLKPLPYPKRKDKKGNHRIRQAFQVHIRDQVAWIAVVNIVGPFVDSQMSTWNYGNRLYRSIWVAEDEDGVRRRKIGRYRQYSGQLYLPFQQSWPIFRRHVYLTTRRMAYSNRNLPVLDQQDREELEIQEQLTEKYRCPFLERSYWEKKKPVGIIKELYWSCIDLEKFYPTLKLDTIRTNIINQIPKEWMPAADKLIKSMLQFDLDTDGWGEEQLKVVGLSKRRKKYSNIPTGLYVAGFLANAGMLEVDQLVESHLPTHKVAHFRYVDDHIVLAYKFSDLVEWIRFYQEILQKSNTGAKINVDKIEPKELSIVLRVNRSLEKAQDATRLDPQFPSPLMTKTLGLVSAIARTDFNMLGDKELATLTDQLEHLLLVNIPEEEIAEKTRLSFAAVRLTQLAQLKLSPSEKLANLYCRKEEISAYLDKKTSDDKEEDLNYLNLASVLSAINKEIEEENERISKDVAETFQLIRKVLREQPDNVRLWARAVLMCRMTGIKGLSALLKDIDRIKEESRSSIASILMTEYLMANMYMLLAEQAIIASRIFKDTEVAQWRKTAAKSFLLDLWENSFKTPSADSLNIVQYSWRIFQYGIYCSIIVIGDSYMATPVVDKELEYDGPEYMARISQRHSPAAWAWWAARMTLRDLSAHADILALDLGLKLRSSTAATIYWSYFPLDIPVNKISSLCKDLDDKTTLSEGWWYDVLTALSKEQNINSISEEDNIALRKAKRAIEIDRKNSVSLYEWCEFIRSKAKDNGYDPRTGEWTALEIVRQIADLLETEPTLQSYLIKPINHVKMTLSLHPANFRIPRVWCKYDTPTWMSWEKDVRKNTVKLIGEEYRIQDRRYSPLIEDNPLFSEINPVRALGLLLHCLLSCSFELPSLWNGPGHSDVLAMLPQLLLRRMTCSSSTLGVLQSCLLSRSIENVYLERKMPQFYIDDDKLEDPRMFISARDVAEAIQICQKRLKANQLSTMNYEARQLTPISIELLTHPDWNKEFSTDKETKDE